MSKLKINRIKLQDLSKDEQKNVQGGGEIQNNKFTTSIVSIPSTVLSVLVCQPGEPDKLTQKPGFQDSCGLCSVQ